jgi:diguanylate cyclase (GGDEF)-like protein
MQEDVDLSTASRFGAFGWGMALAVAAAFLPFFPPTAAIGSAGWLVAAAGFLLIGVWIVPIVARGRSSTTLFLTSFVAIALIAGLEWLVGAEGPYRHLYLFVVLATALVQPPMRLAIVVAAIAVARFLPGTYDPGVFRAGDAAMEVLLWVGLAAFVYTLMEQLRRQRKELESYGAAAERSARLDPLTGLGNRRAFDEDAAKELERYRRTGVPLALAVIDLDAFKPINDEFGHGVGDQVLVAVAEALLGETRTIDGRYRWGGDEFALILPGSRRGPAKMICRRVAEQLERSSPVPDGRPIRVSAGVAEFDGHSTVEAVLEAADAELFEIKRTRHASGVA